MAITPRDDGVRRDDTEHHPQSFRDRGAGHITKKRHPIESPRSMRQQKPRKRSCRRRRHHNKIGGVAPRSACARELLGHRTFPRGHRAPEGAVTKRFGCLLTMVVRRRSTTMPAGRSHSCICAPTHGHAQHREVGRWAQIGRTRVAPRPEPFTPSRSRSQRSSSEPVIYPCSTQLETPTEACPGRSCGPRR